MAIQWCGNSRKQSKRTYEREGVNTPPMIPPKNDNSASQSNSLEGSRKPENQKIPEKPHASSVQSTRSHDRGTPGPQTVEGGLGRALVGGQQTPSPSQEDVVEDSVRYLGAMGLSPGISELRRIIEVVIGRPPSKRWFIASKSAILTFSSVARPRLTRGVGPHLIKRPSSTASGGGRFCVGMAELPSSDRSYSRSGTPADPSIPRPAFRTTSRAWITPLNRVKNRA